jgi:transposase
MSESTSPAQKFVDESTMIRVNHMPVIARMCHRIGLIDLINESIPCNTDLDLGTLVVGMVCDTLSGRSPLYKVEEFIKEQDTELLFGMPVDSHRFNDDALGNALDRIHEKGTLKLFTEVSLKAASVFNLDTSKLSFDTTSVNVWGDYDGAKSGGKIPHITYGFSKDKRMDLKQFMVSMLCVEGNIPISGKMQDGNSSDEKLNNEELQRIGKLLSPLKDNIGELIYVADCKLICAGNMALLDDLLFISRFPGNFKEHNIAVERAIDADDWEELGVLAETPSPSKKRQRANYRSHETAVIIEGKSYRALVIQTDHLDKRRTNGIENRKAKERKLVEKAIKSAEKTTYHCQEDARKALEILSVKRRTNYWNIKGSMEIIQVHAPGRAPKTGNRKIVDTRYRLLLAPDENTGHWHP